MGCVNSKTDINDTHPNIFHVININDQGRPVSRGKLEVTDTELILHQKGKNPTKWPLRSLRKYGWDVHSDVFSIECGRRSPTGPGYYAFKCRKAEQLFNMVQQHIIGSVQDQAAHGNTDNSNMPNQNSVDFPVPTVSTGPPVQRRPDPPTFSTAEPNHLISAQPVARSHAGLLSRPGSITSSGGQISPTTISPPPVITEAPPLEHNNNKRSSSVLENGTGPPNYANFAACEMGEATCHVYMNVDAKEIACSLSQNNFRDNREYQRELSEEVHCYANIDTRDAESIQLLQQHSTVCSTPIPTNGDVTQMYMSNSVPCTPTICDYVMVREVNYAELDLESTKNESGSCVNGNTCVSVLKPSTTTALTAGLLESPTVTKKSYATIDFPKTIALSQSINPKADLEEGSRKTRHNSTIASPSD